MRYTKNLALKQPGYAEGADIELINENMDALDEKVTELDTAAKNLSAKVEALGKDAEGETVNLAAHIEDELPHTFYFGGVRYKYGFGLNEAGGLQIKYEEASK